MTKEKGKVCEGENQGRKGGGEKKIFGRVKEIG
jgi:hypothetical protein